MKNKDAYADAPCSGYDQGSFLFFRLEEPSISQNLHKIDWQPSITFLPNLSQPPESQDGAGGGRREQGPGKYIEWMYNLVSIGSEYFIMHLCALCTTVNLPYIYVRPEYLKFIAVSYINSRIRHEVKEMSSCVISDKVFRGEI